MVERRALHPHQAVALTDASRWYSIQTTHMSLIINQNNEYEMTSTYIKFVLVVSKSGATKTVEVRSKRQDSIVLGVVKWFPTWRKYCFFPNQSTIYDEGCMRDIQSFLLLLNEQHRREVSQRKQLNQPEPLLLEGSED